ncbi:hypothetical protein TDB9533_00048 [Thalassocella blandensis]|nr:hypothetical protein TDB9533_00048 [Thalassocella blandensis]
MAKHLYEATLNQYTKELGLVDVHTDEVHGVCLEFDQKLELCLRWDNQSNQVLAHIFCGYVPSGNNVELLEAILSANFLWMQTGGATLSIDEASNSILLIAKWDEAVYSSAEILKINIDNLVNHAEYWQNNIKESSINQSSHQANSSSFNNVRLS